MKLVKFRRLAVLVLFVPIAMGGCKWYMEGVTDKPEAEPISTTVGGPNQEDQGEPMDNPERADSMDGVEIEGIFRMAKTPYDKVSAATSAEIKDRVADANAFGFKLYQRLANRYADANLLYSPLSLQTALALIYPAAEPGSDIAKELETSLMFRPAGEGFHKRLKGYLLHLESVFAEPLSEKKWEWALVNHVWVEQLLALQSEYLEEVKRHYNAQVGVLDFRSGANAAEESRQIINDYVETKTKQLIKDLLPPGSITSGTAVVLTNSIYMLADWQQPFDPNLTQKAPFTLPSGRKTSVDMMSQTGQFDYMENDQYQALRLPYARGELGMVILLPKARGGLSRVEEGLDQSSYTKLMAALKPVNVSVSLPRFTFTWGSNSLREELRDMGLEKPFRPGDNFPRLVRPLSGGERENFMIDDVVHQAKIIVDEKGTEAAAATGIIMVTTAMPLHPPKEFRVDKPSIFLVCDQKYEGLIFMGRLYNPE